MATGQRSYVGGRFSLNIDGWEVAYLKDFQGLSMEAEIAVNDTATDNIQKKHVTNIKWTEGKATFGAGMGKGMRDWIRASFEKAGTASQTKGGELRAADFDYKCKSVLTFEDALMKELAFPELSGASKEAVYLTMTFEPERVKWNKGGDEDIRGKMGPKQKAWLGANFQVEIDGLECRRIAKVEKFSWKCAIVPDMLGIFVENTKHPAKVTVDDLKLSISYADHQAWADEARKWFIDGQREEANERSGRIVYLGPDMKTPLAEIELKGVGFKAFAAAQMKANAEEVKRFDVTLYVEQMIPKFDYTDA